GHTWRVGPPGRDRRRIVAAHRKSGAGKVKPRQRLAERAAMRRARAANPHTLEECHDCCRPAGQFAEHFSGTVFHRLRTIDPAAGEMFHEPKKKRQIALGYTPLIEREDEMAALGVNQEIRIFDAFGKPLEGRKRAEVVAGKESV